MWNAKEAINGQKVELLQTLSKPQFDFIQSILMYRLGVFSVCANAALLIVGNEETAEAYEHWTDDYAKFMLDETLQNGQLQDPSASPESQPLFTAEMLPQITVDLQVQLMRVVAHYKREVAKRMLLIKQERLKPFTGPSDDQETATIGNDSNTPIEKAYLPDDAQIAAAEAMVKKKSDVDTRHAAFYLRCSTQHVLRLVREGKLVASKTSPKRITSASLQAYMWSR